ncbi:MAG: penicillin acylase family protein [Saprospiraceae bacterium]
MQKILYVVHFILFLTAVLFLNGNVNVAKNPLPPILKFLDPFKGVWNHNVTTDVNKSTLTLPLTSEANMYYDHRWVPHIFAENIEDILFMQGFVEAQNRLFQMEFLAKAAAGELSSILGEVTVEYDLDKRRRGMTYAAENAVAAWEKMPNFALAERYIAGVNAYISELKPEDFPMEYKLFNIKPEPWTMLKSALVFKEMSLTLCGRNQDIPYTNAKNSLDDSTFSSWFPEYEAVENPVVPDHISFDFDSLFTKKQSPSAFINHVIEKSFYEARQPGIGSNQWTIGKNKSASGANIFSNDPHLSLGLPSIWFEQHLVTPTFNAYGVSFPGFPGIMIGFNEHIAWGETNVGQDVEDLFVIQWVDASKKDYVLDNQKIKTKHRVEKIWVKGRKVPLMDTVLYTYFGPVYKTSIDGKSDLALRWLAHDAPSKEEYMAFVDGMQAKDYDSYAKATEVFMTPAQNFGFSSVKGEMAIRVNGLLPAKFDQDGRFVEYGNKVENDWQGFIPRHQNPQVLNPPENFVASANQRSTTKNYPYYYTGNFENYRNRLINDKLIHSEKMTVDDMKGMQNNAFSIKAKEFISLLPDQCKNITGKSQTQWYLKLQQWNAHYKKEAIEPVFFEIYMDHLRKETYDELYTLQEKMAMAIPKDWVLFKMLSLFPNDYLFNIKQTSTIETAENVQIIAFMKTVNNMDSMLQINPALHWGNYKPLHIQHLTRIPGLSSLNLEANGCPDAINAKGNSFGPSWRMIVHQTNPIEAYGVYPGGQSGNPFSPFYKNMIEDWIEGKYHLLNHHNNQEVFKKEAVCTFHFQVKS